MKRILTVLLSVILLFSCGAPKVQKDFEKMLSALKSGDIEKIKKLTPGLEVQFNDEISKMYLEGYKKLSYKIKNTKVTGDTAVINLDMKAPDLSSYFPEYMKKLSEIGGKNLESDPEKIMNQSEKIMSDFFTEKLNSADLKYTEKNIDVHFKKNGKEWEIDYNNSKNKDYISMITLGFLKLGESAMGSDEIFKGAGDSVNLENLTTTTNNNSNSKDVKKSNITEALKTDKVEFKVVSKEVAKVAENIKPDSEGNSFLVLTVKVKNISNSMVIFESGDFYILLDNNKYSPTSLFVKDEMDFKNINPGTEVTGKIFYDMPDNVANSSNLVLKNSDSIFTNIGEIEINLK